MERASVLLASSAYSLLANGGWHVAAQIVMTQASFFKFLCFSFYIYYPLFLSLLCIWGQQHFVFVEIAWGYLGYGP
jgi:hypothetical protein